MHHTSNYSKKHKTLKRKLKIQFALLLVLVFQIVLILSYSTPTKPYSYADKFVYGFGFIIFFNQFDLQVCLRQAKNMCLYVNGLLQFENKYMTKQKNCISVSMRTRLLSLIEKINRCFAHSYCPSSLILSVAFIYGLHWTDPCKPSIIRYWLIPECSLIWNRDQWIWSFPAKDWIFVTNHWAWSFILNASIFVVSEIQVLCTLSLRGYIEM